eukprot:GEZU01010052.1.p1 GENE.GEZU01010052.1~~GEZU01010052.1.p1  ORF type:complete len:265 (-),score=17.53 GEZU01010052.1:67-861(-)
MGARSTEHRSQRLVHVRKEWLPRNQHAHPVVRHTHSMGSYHALLACRCMAPGYMLPASRAAVARNRRLYLVRSRSHRTSPLSNQLNCAYYCLLLIRAVMEYSIHRWAFHMDTSSPLANMIHFMLHGIHHIDPLDRTRLVFPPLPAILAVYIPATYLSSFVITNYSIRHYMTAGAIFGYITYDMTHYILHHGLEGAFVRPLQFLRHCHNHHHFFEGGEKYNFGISFPAKLIDYIMGTHYLPPNTTTTTTTNSTEAEAGTAKASSS